MLKFLFGIVGFLAAGCEPVNAYFGLDDDNVIEESTEALIEWQTHIPLDLTPSSPE